MVLVRDVTDLRRRDRLLMGKDVAIREVHHRVKNNLQTISSLLRFSRDACQRGMPATRWRKPSGGSAASPSSTRSCRGTRPTRSISTTSCLRS